MVKIVAISDTHRKEHFINLPTGDILIFAGDCDIYHWHDLCFFIEWMEKQDFKHKIFIAGNHDIYLEQQVQSELKLFFQKHGICYLNGESIQINNLNIWGSPYTLKFMDWAFMKTEDKLKEIYTKIPLNTDIIITHGPSRNILDYACFSHGNVGSFSLREIIKKIKPKIHIFGHIHGCYGKCSDEHTDYYNVSICDENYDPINEPTIIEI